MQHPGRNDPFKSRTCGFAYICIEVDGNRFVGWGLVTGVIWCSMFFLSRQSITEQPFLNLIETNKIHKRSCKTLDPEAAAYTRALLGYTWGMQ